MFVVCLPVGDVGQGDGFVVFVEHLQPDLVHGVVAVGNVVEDKLAVLDQLMPSAFVLQKKRFSQRNFENNRNFLKTIKK